MLSLIYSKRYFRIFFVHIMADTFSGFPFIIVRSLGFENDVIKVPLDQ